MTQKKLHLLFTFWKRIFGPVLIRKMLQFFRIFNLNRIPLLMRTKSNLFASILWSSLLFTTKKTRSSSGILLPTLFFCSSLLLYIRSYIVLRIQSQREKYDSCKNIDIIWAWSVFPLVVENMAIWWQRKCKQNEITKKRKKQMQTDIRNVRMNSKYVISIVITIVIHN